MVPLFVIVCDLKKRTLQPLQHMFCVFRAPYSWNKGRSLKTRIIYTGYNVSLRDVIGVSFPGGVPSSKRGGGALENYKKQK